MVESDNQGGTIPDAKVNKVIVKIMGKKQEIIKKLTQESIDVYLFLKREFKKGKITNNTLFQFVYRAFYTLDSAGLTEEFKKHILSSWKSASMTKTSLI